VYELGGICSTHGTDEKCIKTMTVKLELRERVGDRDIDRPLYCANSTEMDRNETTCKNVA
jgi:hypothetical protein